MNIYNPVRVILCSECNEEFSTDWTDEEAAEAEREFKRLNAGVSWKAKPSRIVCDPCHAKLARLWGLKASEREEEYQKARDSGCQEGNHLWPIGSKPPRRVCEWCGTVEEEIGNA